MKSTSIELGVTYHLTPEARLSTVKDGEFLDDPQECCFWLPNGENKELRDPVARLKLAGKVHLWYHNTYVEFGVDYPDPLDEIDESVDGWVDRLTKWAESLGEG